MSETRSSAEGAAANQRRELLYSGRVQGVGFRYTAREIAERYQVTGYVQNLSDGSVRLVAEGETSELDRFLGAVGLELERFIVNIQTRFSRATGEFQEFSIRR